MADLSALAIPSEPPPECNSPIPHHQVPTDATHIRANSFRDSVITEPAFGRSEHSSTSATNLRVLFVEDEPGERRIGDTSSAASRLRGQRRRYPNREGVHQSGKKQFVRRDSGGLQPPLLEWNGISRDLAARRLGYSCHRGVGCAGRTDCRGMHQAGRR